MRVDAKKWGIHALKFLQLSVMGMLSPVVFATCFFLSIFCRLSDLDHEVFDVWMDALKDTAADMVEGTL